MSLFREVVRAVLTLVASRATPPRIAPSHLTKPDDEITPEALRTEQEHIKRYIEAQALVKSRKARL